MADDEKTRGSMKRILVIGALVLAAACMVILVALVESGLRVSLAAALSFVTSLALLIVTWFYVGATREMLALQRSERSDRLLDDHFRAAARIWGITNRIDGVILRQRGDIRDAFAAGLKDEDRMSRLQELSSAGDQLDTLADELIQDSVHLVTEVEVPTWKTVYFLGRYARLLTELHNEGLREVLNAKLAKRSFEVANVIASWEAKSSPDHPRWSEVEGDGTLQEASATVEELQDAVRAEIKARQRARA